MPLDSQGILQLHFSADQVGQQSRGPISRPVGASRQSSELGHEIEMDRIPVAESRLRTSRSRNASSCNSPVLIRRRPCSMAMSVVRAIWIASAASA